MKGVITIIALFILISISYKGYSCVDNKSAENRINFYQDLSIIENDSNEDLNFYVSYLLDTNGKPYIVSIKSKDEQMTEMVRKMINQPINHYPTQEGLWYSITFIYDNIQ